MQPLKLLVEYINDISINTISRYPQVVKVYSFMNVLSIDFLEKNGNYIISYFW